MNFVPPWWHGVIQWFVMGFAAASLLFGDAFYRLVEPIAPIVFIVGFVFLMLPVFYLCS